MNDYRRIFLIPVYNEIEHLPELTKDLYVYMDDSDLAVFVDDASVDGSLDFLRKLKKKNFKILSLKKNTGLGGALKIGFRYINKIDYKGPLITIDGDYQHDLTKLEKYITYYQTMEVDFLLIGRIMGVYPLYKKIGNRIFSLWTSIITGKSFFDVETGYRIMSPEMMKNIEPIFKGIRYSCAQELAVLCSLKGYKIDNSKRSRLRHYRTNTSFKDALINFIVSIVTFFRISTEKYRDI
mgnify:CR=1 FL=1